MPSVQRHDGVESWFYDVARKHLTRGPRSGIHVSDLLVPRKAYWAEVQPKPPTNREVVYFLAGRGHEEAFVALAGLSGYHKSRGEWLGPGGEYKQGDGIRYEIDVLTEDGTGREVPMEIKTNRRPTVMTPEKVLEEYQYAVRQLSYYSAIKGLRTAYLVEIHLMARNLVLDEGAAPGEAGDEFATGERDNPYAWLKESRPEIVVYQLDFTEKEQDAIRRDMVSRRALLDRAREIRDHTILPECESWMCGKEHVKTSDPRCDACGTSYENRRLRKCPSCRSNLVRDSATVFVPTCKWWKDCLPTQWSQFHQSYFRPAKDSE